MSQNKLNNVGIWLQPLVTADLQADCIGELGANSWFHHKRCHKQGVQ